MNILSIQSWVASGHVGNAAAVFPLQRLGAEVTAINTVQFSNHPGHGAFTGRVYPAADIAALVDGLEAHGTLATCDGMLSGYIGDAAVGAVIVDAATRVRAANRAALWCCDPVMGDDGRLYVRADIPEFFAAHAVPAADLLAPNQFELATLSGNACTAFADAKAAAGALRARMRGAGPQVVLVTSLRTSETPADALDMLLASGEGFFRIRTDLLPAKFSGAGDALAALFLFHVLRSGDVATAGVRAARGLAGILWRTWQSGAPELQLVAAQDELLAPTRKAEIESC